MKVDVEVLFPFVPVGQIGEDIDQEFSRRALRLQSHDAVTTGGGRDIPPPDITPNSTLPPPFWLAQNVAYSSKTGRYSAASGE